MPERFHVKNIITFIVAAILWIVYLPTQVYTEEKRVSINVESEPVSVTIEFNPIVFSVDLSLPGESSSEEENQEMVEWFIWDYLYRYIGNSYGVAGLMGNLYAESRLRSHNLENAYERSLKMTDSEYTDAVNNHSYGKEKFSNDWAGYGLAQWTDPVRKKRMYEHIVEKGIDISDLEAQLDYLIFELNKYNNVLYTLRNATSLKQASDVVLLEFERPFNISEKVKQTRVSYGQVYLDKYS